MKSYNLKLVVTEVDIAVLQKALETYKPNKKSERITKDLLSIIEYQKDKQNEK